MGKWKQSLNVDGNPDRITAR